MIFNSKDICMKMIKNFLNDETGVTAIEYGLIAVVISVAIIVAVQGLGTQLSTTFNKVTTQLKTAG